MQKKLLFKPLFILLLLLGIYTQSLFADSKNQTMYICLNTVDVMEKPSTRSKKTGTLSYSNKVSVTEEKNNWSFIQAEDNSSVTGWVPSGALTKKKITAKNKASSANASEIALAGKGFSSSIEKEYAQKHQVDFSEIDYIENLSVTEDKNIKFMKEGNLKAGENDEE